MARLHTLTDNQRKALRRVRRIVELFRNIEPRIPSSYMDAFLSVALKPGGGPTDYARDLGTSQPLASRVLLEIGMLKSRNQGDVAVDRGHGKRLKGTEHMATAFMILVFLFVIGGVGR
jgi:hypothetical protein